MVLRVPENIANTVAEVSRVIGETPIVHNESIDDISINIKHDIDLVAFMPSAYRTPTSRGYGSPINHMQTLSQIESPLSPKVYSFCNLGNDRYGVLSEKLNEVDTLQLDTISLDKYIANAYQGISKIFLGEDEKIKSVSSLDEAIDYYISREIALQFKNTKNSINEIMRSHFLKQDFMISWYGTAQAFNDIGVNTQAFNSNMFGLDNNNSIKIRSTTGFQSKNQRDQIPINLSFEAAYNMLKDKDRNLSQ